MPETVRFVFVVVLAWGGAALLHTSVSSRDGIQTAELVAGASLISLALLSLVLLTKNWLHRRKYYDVPESGGLGTLSEQKEESIR